MRSVATFNALKNHMNRLTWSQQFDSSLRRYYSIRASGPDGSMSTAVLRSSLTLGGFCKFTPEVAESFLNALAEQSIRLEAMEVIDAL